mmetsp:Transcript_38213/g.94966  ORF Transcript_38213/g.94966 Transcript_38213/m.94966 type:complete len:301 (-) Transcript_38213:217-1119(-)
MVHHHCRKPHAADAWLYAHLRFHPWPQESHVNCGELGGCSVPLGDVQETPGRVLLLLRHRYRRRRHRLRRRRCPLGASAAHKQQHCGAERIGDHWEHRLIQPHHHGQPRGVDERGHRGGLHCPREHLCAGRRRRRRRRVDGDKGGQARGAKAQAGEDLRGHRSLLLALGHVHVTEPRVFPRRRRRRREGVACMRPAPNKHVHGGVAVAPRKERLYLAAGQRDHGRGPQASQVRHDVRCCPPATPVVGVELPIHEHLQARESFDSEPLHDLFVLGTVRVHLCQPHARRSLQPPRRLLELGK